MADERALGLRRTANAVDHVRAGYSGSHSYSRLVFRRSSCSWRWFSNASFQGSRVQRAFRLCDMRGDSIHQWRREAIIGLKTQLPEARAVFAGRETLLRVPRTIEAQYAIDRNVVTLTYIAGGAEAARKSRFSTEAPPFPVSCSAIGRDARRRHSIEG